MADHMGQQFGNYRLLRRLGKGGFGQVYLGEHVYLKTHAAIKLLLEDVDDAQEEAFHTAFLQEARNIARLKHPHILRVLEFGVEMSSPYLVMEYAAHGTLLERHPRGTKVVLDQVVSYTKQIAQALQYAHEAGLIHRDVKPANVLLDERDTVQLSDFGIATIVHHTSSMRTSAYAGTAAYMAPEQLQGKPVPASDQYALAIMVYEWLCGLPPYQGDPVAVGMQHLMAPIPSLCMHNDVLSPSIETVVHQAMAKDPKQRFVDIIAFANALSQAANGQPVFPPVYVSQPPERLVSQSPQLAEVRPIPPTRASDLEAQLETEGFDTPKQNPLRIQLGKLLSWFVICSEVILACRFVFKLIGASESNLIVSFLYGLTDIVLFPFHGLVITPLRFDLTALIAMIIYWLLFWAVRRFLSILITRSEDTED